MSKLSDAISNIIIDEDKTFGDYCTGCGGCCTRVNIGITNIESIASKYNIPIEELSFLYRWDENGRCEMLDNNNRCMVYLNRPNICNIDWLQKNSNSSKEEFYIENINACNTIIDEDKLDKRYKIVI